MGVSLTATGLAAACPYVLLPFLFPLSICIPRRLHGGGQGAGRQPHQLRVQIVEIVEIVNPKPSPRPPPRPPAGFMEVDKALGGSRIDCEFSGSTSVVAFLKGRMLTTAWVGDSRGVLGRTNGKGGFTAIPLTKDHKPTSPEEMARITATNGRVERCVRWVFSGIWGFPCLPILSSYLRGRGGAWQWDSRETGLGFECSVGGTSGIWQWDSRETGVGFQVFEGSICL